MKNEIPMKQYGLSETFEKSSEQFAGLTVARILSQEKGIYRLVSSQGEKLGEISGRFHYEIQTKSDLCEDLDHKLMEVSSVAAGVDILVTNAKEQTGYEQIYPYLTEGKTIAFIGSSGVGKSTLINCLLGKQYLDTNGLRNDDKGRHTTTHRELIRLPSGGMVIDTPGMRELGM